MHWAEGYKMQSRRVILIYAVLMSVFVFGCRSQITPSDTDKDKKIYNNYKEEGENAQKNRSIFEDNYSVALVEYTSLPQKISLNKSFKSDEFPNVKVKLLQIVKEKNKCLLKYEGPYDSNIINPQWYQKNDAIFPTIYGNFGVTINDIFEDEIFVVIHWGAIESEKEHQIITIKQNETTPLFRLPKVKIRLLQIDKNREKCLIGCEGISGENIANPQWFQKGEEIFPEALEQYCLIIENIRDDRIYIQLYWPRNDSQDK